PPAPSGATGRVPSLSCSRPCKVICPDRMRHSIMSDANHSLPSVGERVLDLVVLAEDLRLQGQHATPEELCRDCPELLEPLRQALRAGDYMDGLLQDESPPDKGPVNTPPAAAPAAPASLPAVPGYEILGELGGGGMGLVYRARQVRAGREVALKMIRTEEFATPTDVQRFRNEAEAVAHLDHPPTPPIFHVGASEGPPSSPT